MKAWIPALAHKDYRHYFFGLVASWFGTWMQQVALGWWAYRLSGSVSVLAIVGVCSQLPILFLGPWAATVSDHMDRRKGLLATQALSLVQAAALCALFYSGGATVETIIACSLFLGVVSTLDIPLRQSFTSNLVPAHDLKNAIALSAACANAMRLVAPAAAGLIIAWGGEGVCFAINAASYAGVLGVLWSLPAQEAAAIREPGAGVFKIFGEGVRHALDDPWIASGLGMALLVSLFATPYLAIMPALVKDVFKTGPALYGLAMGASGIGATLSGVAMAARPGLMGKKAMPWLGAGGAIGLALMASMPNAWWALPFLMATGFGLSGAALAANAIVQSRAAPAMRGRVMGMFSMCLYGASPLGMVAMGSIAEKFGPRAAVVSGGAGALVASVMLGLFMSKKAPAWRLAALEAEQALVDNERVEPSQEPRSEAALGRLGTPLI